MMQAGSPMPPGGGGPSAPMPPQSPPGGGSGGFHTELMTRLRTLSPADVQTLRAGVSPDAQAIIARLLPEIAQLIGGGRGAPAGAPMPPPMPPAGGAPGGGGGPSMPLPQQKSPFARM